ncbi:MAG: dipeptide ABC transporter ATP-binding protein [Novosphingobium sp.]
MTVVPISNALLQVRDLAVTLSENGAAIVADVAFSVQPGEILGIVGESGSGKTSIATALLGDARAGAVIAGGSILVDGRDILALSEQERQKVRGPVIAHVAQDPALALNPMLRIGSQLEELLLVHAPELDGAARRIRIAEAAADVGLPGDAEFLRRFPHQLSGGQQQRVLLALAVLLRPKLIVLDEPTTALDVSTQARVLRTLRALCRTRGIGAIYVSHDLAVVGELVDRVIVLYAGRVVEQGTRDQIFDRPVHPYTRGLLGAVPDIVGTRPVRPIPGHAPALNERPLGCAFAPRCAQASELCATQPALVDIGERRLTACHHPFRDQLIPAAIPQRPIPGPTPGPEEAILARIDKVNASYGSNQVLFDVALDLPEGRCTALVGESGSGKTTLARSLVGLVDGVEGGFDYAGSPIVLSGGRTREQRRKIQYIFQNPYRALNPRHTVREILTTAVRHFFPMSKAAAQAEVNAVLEKVALPPKLAGRYARELSGGERQRVAIARALICRPELLICDEITSALDVSVQAAILDLLRDLQQQENLTVLFVTHDLGVVRAMADYVAVLQHGEIVEHGSVDRVLDAPDHDYTRSLVADSPRLRAEAA